METKPSPFPAPGSRTLAEIYDDLRKEPRASDLREKDTGKFKATYMHHATLRDYLDFLAPGWEWVTTISRLDSRVPVMDSKKENNKWVKVPRLDDEGNQIFEDRGLVYVSGTLIIHGSDGRVARDGIGNEDDVVASYGDPSSNAEAMALRRAAMAHGFCRSLWKK